MLLSLVIPVLDEEESLPALVDVLARVLGTMDLEYEVIFIDDGSRDGTRRFLAEEAAVDPRIKVLVFSRNFGHQAAITAGIDFASGDAVIVMDADLQDPPELISEMIALYQQGYEVVSPQRIDRVGESRFKRGAAALFYWVMRRGVDERLQAQVGDFRLFSRSAVQAIREFREQHRFMRGMVAWLGLREAVIPFRRPPRMLGSTKYPFWKMAKFAWTAVSSFSALPLKLFLAGGLLMTFCGIVYSAYVIYESLILKTTVRGWSSLVCLQLLFSGAVLTALGLVGDYVARIYEEVKQRPLYVVTEAMNLNADQAQPHRAIVAAASSRGGVAAAFAASQRMSRHGGGANR